MRAIHISLGVVALSIAACAVTPPVQGFFWKEGTSASQRASDLTDCEVHALQAAPRAVSTTPNAAYQMPDNVQCTQVGYYTNCYNYGGQTIGGGTTTVDHNAELRSRVTIQCMAQRGYSVENFRVCTREEASMGLVRRAAPTPRASDVLCVTPEGYVSR